MQLSLTLNILTMGRFPVYFAPHKFFSFLQTVNDHRHFVSFISSNCIFPHHLSWSLNWGDREGRRLVWNSLHMLCSVLFFKIASLLYAQYVFLYLWILALPSCCINKALTSWAKINSMEHTCQVNQHA